MARNPHTPDPKMVGALLFPRFELLDIFGPLEMFGVLTKHFTVVTVAEHAEPVPSAQAPRSAIDFTFDNCPPLDVLLVPGGQGTREQADNPVLLEFLRTTYPHLEHIGSICTGSGLLAAAGLLDGRRATSNKMSFQWACSRGPQTQWIAEARWVEDGNVWTSGGVAAGIDMSLALIAHLVDEATAVEVARYTEYEWHRDASWDPFAAKAGLV